MNKEELAVKMACTSCGVQRFCNDPWNPTEDCEPYRNAKRLVEAGYGNAKEILQQLIELSKRETPLIADIQELAEKYGVEIEK